MNFISKFYVLWNLFIDWCAALGARGSRHRVALIKLDAIGDFLLWLNAAEALSRKFGPDNIVLIVARSNADFARSLPFWNDVVELDTSAFVRDRTIRSRTIRKISRMRFDIAIHCTYSRVFETGDAVLRATGARQRIGSRGDLLNISPFKKRIADRWYTKLIPTDAEHLHESLRHEEFLHALGVEDYRAGVYRIPKQKVDTQQTHPSRMGYFLVFPGGSWKGRQWEAQKFVELIDRLQKLTGLECILCGGEAERPLCAEIANSCQAIRMVRNLAGNTSLAAFFELLRLAQFLIGNETMCIHAAASVDTPAVCILGGGHYGYFVPYPTGLGCDVEQYVAHSQDTHCFHCNWKCNQGYSGNGPVPCVAQIGVDNVFHLCEQLWQKLQRKNGS